MVSSFEMKKPSFLTLYFWGNSTCQCIRTTTGTVKLGEAVRL